MSFSSTTGHSSPKSNEWTCTDRMKRGRVTCWNLSWMKSRMESARARPEGPVVRVGQSISMDMTWSVCARAEGRRGGFGIGSERRVGRRDGLISGWVYPVTASRRQRQFLPHRLRNSPSLSSTFTGDRCNVSAARYPHHCIGQKSSRFQIPVSWKQSHPSISVSRHLSM